MLTVVALVSGATTTASWSAPRKSADQDLIGIKLLDAPVSRRDDPRAQMYIVDHLAPGAVINRRVELWNSTDTAKSFDAYAAGADIRDARFTFADGRTGNDLSGWISFERTKVDLPPHSRAPVAVTITVPPKATRGEQYAVIWAQVEAPAGANGNIGMINRVGVRVYLDIGPGGEPPSDFVIEQLTPARRTDGRPEVVAQVHNTGGRTVDIGGSLKLTDGPGSLSAGPFEAETGTTIAIGGSAAVHVLLDKRLPAGPWTAELTLTSGTVRRSATAVLTFPDSVGAGTPVAPESDFPLFALIAGAVVAACAVLSWTAVRVRRRSRATA